MYTRFAYIDTAQSQNKYRNSKLNTIYNIIIYIVIGHTYHIQKCV